MAVQVEQEIREPRTIPEVIEHHLRCLGSKADQGTIRAWQVELATCDPQLLLGASRSIMAAPEGGRGRNTVASLRATYQKSYGALRHAEKRRVESFAVIDMPAEVHKRAKWLYCSHPDTIDEGTRFLKACDYLREEGAMHYS